MQRRRPNLLTLDIPPGLRADGTDLQTEGYWLDCNLVRWSGRVMQPVGGWVSRGVSVGAAPRGALAWRDNAGDARAAFGSSDALHIMTIGNVLTNIEPLDLATGRVDAGAVVGYGVGPYGEEAYGVVRTETASGEPATTWSLDTWGENLLAVSRDDKRILEWTPTTVGPAVPIAGAPACGAMVVTDERFVFALGSGGRARVRWSDRENNALWTPAATNEAGDITLQSEGSILAGCRANGQTLILTTRDAHAATYIGPPFVYRFDRVGSACGLVAPLAFAGIASGVAWMGERGFFVFSGGAVQEVPCAIADRVFSDINRRQVSKVAAHTVEAQNEVWWLYPSEESIECDRYVAWNYRDNTWHRGSIDRTTGIDAGVFAKPMMTGPLGVVYNHEQGFAYGGLKPWAETAPITQGGQVFTATELCLLYTSDAADE